MNLPSKFVAYFFLALILPLASAHAQMRTWTASPAGHIQAEYVGLKDGVVSLRSSDGGVHRVRLDQLVFEDQKVGVLPASEYESEAVGCKRESLRGHSKPLR